VRFFNRKVRAVIGRRGESGIEITTRISFDVQKTPAPTANKGNIAFYNLARKTRDFLELENLYCELYAGHEDNQSLIFVGSIANINPDEKTFDSVTSEVSGRDIITKIECRDASDVYRSTVSVRAQKGESKKGVIEQVIGSLGISQGAITGLPEGSYERGFSFEGLLPDFLTQALKANSAAWAIHDEILQITPVEKPVDDEAVIVEPDTGLYDNLQKRTQKGSTTIIELQGSCLLNPIIKPGKLLRVRSAKFSKSGNLDDLGLWLTQEVKHAGDSWSGDYRTDFRAKKYVN